MNSKRYVFCRVVLLFSFTILCVDNRDIDSDYYYGSNMVVRSRADPIQKCSDELFKYNCLLTCQGRKFDCTDDNCVCLSAVSSSTAKLEVRVQKKKSVAEIFLPEDKKWGDQYLTAPVLRHHIAHFCPDLEIARKCIRKCITQGKPAFCGKDHVCYCSHKQKYPGTQSINASDIYTQFKDMYLKYFGPGIFNQLSTTTAKPKKTKKPAKPEKESVEAKDATKEEEEEAEDEKLKESGESKEKEKGSEEEEKEKEGEAKAEGETEKAEEEAEGATEAPAEATEAAEEA